MIGMVIAVAMMAPSLGPGAADAAAALAAAVAAAALAVVVVERSFDHRLKKMMMMTMMMAMMRMMMTDGQVNSPVPALFPGSASPPLQPRAPAASPSKSWAKERLRSGR